MESNSLVKRNQELVRQRIGQTEIRQDIFTEDQMETFSKVMTIADKNPELQWKRGDPNHNLDFCIVEGKIEPVKNFCLKVQYVGGLSMANTGTEVIGEGLETKVVATVRVWRTDEKRYVELQGASTVRECGAARNKPNQRAFHDAVARAQTRAFKSALEAYMGFPFINLAIQQLFGGFEVTGAPEDEGIQPRDVTGSNGSSGEGDQEEHLEEKKMVNKIWKNAKIAQAHGYISEEELEEWRDSIHKNKLNMDWLVNANVELNKQIDIRKKQKQG